MTFENFYILFGLPLIALPILIHLINQHRHRTIHWAAMMFLRDAKRMTRGLAKLKYFLIMLARMLAIAGLIFAASRPFATGWLGLTAGGAADTTLILLDRSASMEQQNLQTNASKRSTSMEKLADLITNVGRNTRIVLIENTAVEPREIESPDALVDLPDTSSTATSADLPAMFQAALDYVTTNETGRTDIWVCSDLREGDWDPEGGRWEGVRAGFTQRQSVRFYLLTYPRIAEDNIAVSVSGVHRRQIGNDAELVMDLKLTRASSNSGDLKVPVQLIINGARSTFEVEMTGTEYLKQGHTVPIDRQIERGWGRVELPNDSNPQDNEFHFVFADAPLHYTAIVSDDKASANLLQLAAGTPTRSSVKHEAEVFSADRAEEIPWDQTAMLLWHAQLPDELTAKQIENFVNNGGVVIFFPPETPNGNTMFNAGWGEWTRSDKVHVPIIGWREDADLLSHTQTGKPLPLGELRTFQFCSLQSEGTSVLARLDGGRPLLARSPTDHGAVYFCSTLPQASHSSLGRDGIVFYVMLQRALAHGASSLGNARQVHAGDLDRGELDDWKPIDNMQADVLLSERSLQPGSWRTEERLVSVNRPEREDDTRVMDDPKLETVMGALDYTRIDDDVGSARQLANEIWRLFLIVMIVALIAEALLCLPEKREASESETLSNTASETIA